MAKSIREADWTRESVIGEKSWRQTNPRKGKLGAHEVTEDWEQHETRGVGFATYSLAEASTVAMAVHPNEAGDLNRFNEQREKWARPSEMRTTRVVETRTCKMEREMMNPASALEQESSDLIDGGRDKAQNKIRSA
jgi:hypothetical protein